MMLGNLISHFERTELDSYLILYSQVTCRRIQELTGWLPTTETTREPEENTA